MKYFITIILLFSFIQIGFAQKNAKIVFDITEKNFGDIIQGDTISFTFEFTNTGEDTLKLKNVITTCSCTSREYTQSPIAPGEKGFVKVNFDSKNKIGRQNKQITIISNADNSITYVKLICNVLPKEK